MTEQETHKIEFLFVDLDDSLVKTDVLHEQVLQVLKSKPFYIFRLLVLALQGPVGFKNSVSKTASLRADLLPYRQEVLDEIKRGKLQGQKVYLASASPAPWVEAVASHLGIFDGWIGTQSVNLKGENKSREIEKIAQGRSYSYVGDSRSDLDIWKRAREAIVVNPTAATREGVDQLKIPYRLIEDRKPIIKTIVRALRVHQWAKNGLIFVPQLVAHQFLDTSMAARNFLAVLAFSATASWVYLLNDLLDLNSDRQHTSKKKRPLAAGDLSVSQGVLLAGGIGCVAVAAALPLGFSVLGLLGIYVLFNAIYSFWAKRVVMLDVVLLAAFYTLRLLVGGQSAQVPISQWLLAFSTFFFFSLALVKRYTELLRKSSDTVSIPGRGYGAIDRETILALGTGSALMSVMILILYLNSHEVVQLYRTPERLWMVAPFLLYWLSRLWIRTQRGQIHDDPVIDALKDPSAWVVLVGILIVMGVAL